jgi:AmmeMemoRadiSam system protein B
MSIRKAAVAGQFYEADTALLQQQVGDLMSVAPSDFESVPKALIVPHAGYIYSGSTAARAYRCLQSQRDVIRRVVLPPGLPGRHGCAIGGSICHSPG